MLGFPPVPPRICAGQKEGQCCLLPRHLEQGRWWCDAHAPSIVARRSAASRKALERKRQQRQQWRPTVEEPSLQAKTSDRFYCIRLIPERPQRVKLGFTGSMVQRVKGYQTASPTLEVIGAWPCSRSVEKRVIALMVQKFGARRVGPEVFDFDDVPALKAALDDFFQKRGLELSQLVPAGWAEHFEERFPNGPECALCVPEESSMLCHWCRSLPTRYVDDCDRVNSVHNNGLYTPEEATADLEMDRENDASEAAAEEC